MNSRSGNLLAFNQQKRAKFIASHPPSSACVSEIEATIDGNDRFVNIKNCASQNTYEAEHKIGCIHQAQRAQRGFFIRSGNDDRIKTLTLRTGILVVERQRWMENRSFTDSPSEAHFPGALSVSCRLWITEALALDKRPGLCYKDGDW